MLTKKGARSARILMTAEYSFSSLVSPHSKDLILHGALCKIIEQEKIVQRCGIWTFARTQTAAGDSLTLLLPQDIHRYYS